MGLVNRHRIPHCSKCERCKSVIMVGSNTREYSCYKDVCSNEYGEVYGSLGVDKPTKKVLNGAL